MFNCFIVNCDSKLPNRKLYIRHLKDHETLSAITFPAFCMQPGCSKNKCVGRGFFKQSACF